jgi:outer membrane protein OmpA-like peptidoglycan-associated protein
VPSIVNQALRSSSQPLGVFTRAFMEPRFGRDFSLIRVHTDARAAESTQAVNAQAYTVGRDLVFGAGQFAPDTVDGRKLLAHELAHVAQPKNGGAGGVSQPGDAGEREAERAADAFARGERVEVGAAPGAALQRQPLPSSRSGTAGDSLIENASPFLAAAVGSATLDEFDTGKADLKPGHKAQLSSVAHSILVLLRKYSLSTVTVIGHADTVGTDAKNLELGQDRADVVKRALSDLGVPEAIISADSKGEEGPQAVKTKDERPSAKNRRVEIQFHPQASNLRPMTAGLTPPSVGKQSGEFEPLRKPPLDLTYHPKIELPDPTKVPANVWKPIPPAPRGSGPKSPLDVVAERFLDPVIDVVARALGKTLRDKIKEGARDAVKAGVAKGARAAAEAAGLKDPAGLDAIEKAAEAAIQTKGQTQP